jgi:hypothetical protein
VQNRSFFNPKKNLLRVKQNGVETNRMELARPKLIFVYLSVLEATHAQWRYHAGIEQQNIIEKKVSSFNNDALLLLGNSTVK